MKTPLCPTLSLADIEAARVRIASGLRLTPCLVAPVISRQVGRHVWLKRDDLQRTGSFKERGARHALLCLSAEERSRGVIAASAGNHALGLAFHGAQLGVRVTVVMPRTAPELKITKCRGLGAEVVVQGDDFEAAQRHALRLAAESGARVVHPFDDLPVIAGQGTMALEVLAQAPEADAIVVPVGGGGLLAGVATAVKSVRPEMRVIAVEPAHAPSLIAAYLHGQPTVANVQPTLADGLAVARVGERAFAIAAPLIDDIVTVNEAELSAAVVVLARHGIVAEGAGAAALAAVSSGKIAARRVVVPICGRNIDVRLHAALLARGGLRTADSGAPDFTARAA